MTKDQVLEILVKESDYVSGERISNQLGISRAAVNSAVKTLRKEGYTILSTTNRGYLLESSPDILSVGEIASYLSPDRMKKVIVADTIDSTNKQLKQMGCDGAPHGQVIVANHQTGGRGRRGRSFVSPPNTGVYLSILLRPEVPPTEISTITAWTSVAIRNAIKNAFDIDVGIKWVNDLVLNNRKICGILTELSIESESGSIDNVVIGIGVNVNNKETDFPEEIRNVATSLSMENNGYIYNRSRLAAQMIIELDKLAEAWPDNKEEYLSMYRKASVTTGSDVTVIPTGSDEIKNGKAIEINEDFSLKVELDDGTIKDLNSGEVSVHGINGYT